MSILILNPHIVYEARHDELYEKGYTIGMFNDYHLAYKALGDYNKTHTPRENIEDYLWVKTIFIDNYNSYHAINPIYDYKPN